MSWPEPGAAVRVQLGAWPGASSCTGKQGRQPTLLDRALAVDRRLGKASQSQEVALLGLGPEAAPDPA